MYESVIDIINGEVRMNVDDACFLWGCFVLFWGCRGMYCADSDCSGVLLLGNHVVRRATIHFGDRGG